ncbi:hypothetical protein MNBD_GAMMA21-1212 [hydrothermal vent metagenome]|uniref:AB hydrolase-1 domain-containing protein n=1 Tax=hydrothermal vent metagenome TaxID=652676 RepID=A0A3B1AI21_9ZZZZ
MLKKWVALILASGILGLSACTTIDQQAFFDEHERAFKAKTGYITHFVQRDGIKIHVREFGTKGSRPTLIMLHGFPDSMHLYDWLVPEMIPDRHIVTFDFTGWGDSDKPEHYKYDFASLRDDLDRVITQLKLTEVVLVLHDASGPPGIEWALAHPDKTKGLVLLNTFYGPMPTLKAPEAIARFSTPGLYRDVSVFMATQSDYIWFNGYSEQLTKFISTVERRDKVIKILAHQSFAIRPAFFSLNKVLLEEVAKHNAMAEELESFTRPVRIIFGADDPYLNIGVAQEFHRLFPRSELFLIEDAGHFVQIDKPERVAELLRYFPDFKSTTQPE